MVSIQSLVRSLYWNRVYRRNLFQGIESHSGTGSSKAATKNIRPFIEDLIIEKQIVSLIDAPCGDLNWILECDISNLKYTGVDISAAVIMRSQKQFPKFDLRIYDVIDQPLWTCDLILMRDLLVHLNFADIQKVISNILKSNSKYLLVTNFPSQITNVDIQTSFFGSVKWRPLNLQLSPFNFPNPLARCYEDYEGNGTFSDKALDLYLISDLKQNRNIG